MLSYGTLTLNVAGNSQIIWQICLPSPSAFINYHKKVLILTALCTTLSFFQSISYRNTDQNKTGQTTAQICTISPSPKGITNIYL